MAIKFIFLASSSLLHGLLLYSFSIAAEPLQDKDTLLDFIANIDHSPELINWDRNISACGGGWTAVTCNDDGSSIAAVQLPNAGLSGIIPTDTLSRLSALQILSLKFNNISGNFPSDLLKLKNLTALQLEFNNFNGPLPLDFTGWENLETLNLSSNGFNGSIPPSLSQLSHLTALDISNNSLSGEVPDLGIASLKQLNLSNNDLVGSVPPSLLRFPKSAFASNNMLKFHKLPIVGIAVGCSAAVAVFVALVLIFIRRKKTSNSNAPILPSSRRKATAMMTSSGVSNHCSSMIFFEGCNLAFDLEDLLRASAEVLGKGSFGMTYRAVLEDASAVAVKRLKDVLIGGKEFKQQMEVVGNIHHDNIAPLRAYYYSKDEKLMVYDFYWRGSLSALLHNMQQRVPLSWEARLKLAIGAARGIAHIHSQGGGKLIHGNIKASNIFLNSQDYGCIGDLGLATLMSPMGSSVLQSAGYCAPEIASTGRLSQEGDVYGFGIVLLEILTGKSPAITSGRRKEGMHLVKWVEAVVHEEWTGEVFDPELMMMYVDVDEEMVAMLQVGLSCVAGAPEQRPKIGEVLKMVEGIRSF
ncbi:probable inactive receptor kinase At4g23740 [Andrographis paniculata]|uniref:probable inactive receptor kinase At4g23740 n=1 Tax=Andrographis paniculata TaxID=175694 RepID=UPI0021E886B7|nr:probable inactive receptor kinase At4g23740 [Andrographis paniculata]